MSNVPQQLGAGCTPTSASAFPSKARVTASPALSNLSAVIFFIYPIIVSRKPFGGLYVIVGLEFWGGLGERGHTLSENMVRGVLHPPCHSAPALQVVGECLSPALHLRNLWLRD